MIDVLCDMRVKYFYSFCFYWEGMGKDIFRNRGGMFLKVYFYGIYNFECFEVMRRWYGN